MYFNSAAASGEALGVTGLIEVQPTQKAAKKSPDKIRLKFMVSTSVGVDFSHPSRNAPRLQPGFFTAMDFDQQKGEWKFPFAWW